MVCIRFGFCVVVCCSSVGRVFGWWCFSLLLRKFCIRLCRCSVSFLLFSVLMKRL